MFRPQPRNVAAIGSLFLLISLAHGVLADSRATAAEAQALVARAIEYYDTQGKEAAFAAFDQGTEGFTNHDLYIFVYGPRRTIVAHGADTALIGTPADSLIDMDGVPFGAMFMDDSTADGVWIKYKWRDPVSGEILPKTSWVVLHDGYVFGAGSYGE